MRRALPTIVICAFVFGCEIRKRKPEGESTPQVEDAAVTTPRNR